MKKRLLTLLVLLSLCPLAFAENNTAIQNVSVYTTNKKFGLKTSQTEITKAEYTKLIRLGDGAWIAQRKNRYGLINSNGEILVPIKYRWADRVASNLVKLGNDYDFGLYNDRGEVVVPPEYSQIERISRDFFLTCKNYKYGLVDLSGKVVLRNKFDSITIPDSKTLIIQYNGEWYKLDVVQKDGVNFEIERAKDDDITIGDVMVKTGAVSGYSVLTFTDYVIKLFSSLSPAYEATIDELMFQKGADSIPIIMNFSWIPKMPVTYLKNYYKNLRKQDSDVLSPARNYLKKHI